MTTELTQITDRHSFDEVVSRATTTTSHHPTGQPTVILITHAPGPTTKAFLPKYEEVVADQKWKHVVFCQMEESPDTSPMIKFGPQARPIVMLIRKEWSRTLATPRFHEFVQVLEDSFGDASG